jgi:hypothetical protein
MRLALPMVALMLLASTPATSRIFSSLQHPPGRATKIVGPDGQEYTLRSGGLGPVKASGSFGAMLEGRNPETDPAR